MNLRKATLLTIIISYVCLIAVIFIASNLVLVKDMAELENNYAKENVERAVLALDQRTSSLDKVTHDWASWDDTYNFLNGKHPDYVKQNFMDEAFIDLGINLMMILDNNRKIRFSKMYNLKLGKEVPVDGEILETVESSVNLSSIKETDRIVSGILMVSGKPMILSFRPILTSLNKGPAAGTFVMGDFLDDADINDLSRITQLSMKFFQSTDRNLPEDIRNALSQLLVSGKIATAELDRNSIIGYTLIEDISGKPSIILKVKMSSGTYIQARKAILYFIAGIIAVGIISAFIIIAFMEKNILARLYKVMNGVISIRETGSLKGRITLPGKDEFSKLTEEINSMMDSLERSEDALLDSEEKYRNLVELANDGIVITQDKIVHYVNPRVSDMLGYSPDEILGSFVTDFIHPGDAERIQNGYSEGKGKYNISRIFEASLKHKNGYYIPVEASIRNMRFKNNQAELTILRDMTERKKAQDMLYSEKEKLLITLTSIGEGVITTDTEMNVVIINKMAEMLTGWHYSEAQGKPLTEVFHIITGDEKEQYYEPFKDIITGCISVELADQVKLISKDGFEHVIAVTGAPICAKEGTPQGIVLVFRDMTEKQKIRNDLSKIERFDTMNLLSSGIAHEFNNILTRIIGNITLAKEFYSLDDRLSECINEAEMASFRARELAQQLLGFIQGSRPGKIKMSVAEIIKDSTGFVLKGSNIKCSFDIPPDLWLINIDPGQISQVIYNIVLNSRQAMPEGGQIYITAENMMVGEEHNLSLAFGKYIRIRIEDTGPGIPNEIIPRIFDPFFTTKDYGSGLGLSSTKATITEHLGIITVDSKPGCYTAFEIYLPAVKEQ